MRNSGRLLVFIQLKTESRILRLQLFDFQEQNFDVFVVVVVVVVVVIVVVVVTVVIVVVEIVTDAFICGVIRQVKWLQSDAY